MFVYFIYAVRSATKISFIALYHKIKLLLLASHLVIVVFDFVFQVFTYLIEHHVTLPAYMNIFIVPHFHINVLNTT